MTDKDPPDDLPPDNNAAPSDHQSQDADADAVEPEGHEEVADFAAKTGRGFIPTTTERAILKRARDIAAQQPIINPAVLQAATDAAKHMASVNALNFDLPSYKPLLDPAFFSTIRPAIQLEEVQRAIRNLLGDQDRQWRQLASSIAASSMAAANQSLLALASAPMWEAMRQHAASLAALSIANLGIQDIVANFSRSFQIDWRQFFPNLKPLKKAMRNRLLVSFVRAELWPAPSMPADLFDRIADLPPDGDRRPITLAVWNTYRRNDHSILESALAGWWDDPEYVARRPIFETALRCHKRKDYEVTIPTLLAQVEGIASDFVHESANISSGTQIPKVGKTNLVVAHALKTAGSAGIIDPDDGDILHIVLMEAVIEYVQCISFENTDFAADYDKLRSRRKLNRHAILHGIQIRYASPMNSLRCFLLLDALYALRKHARQVASQQTPQSISPPKPKRPSPRRRASRPPGP